MRAHPAPCLLHRHEPVAACALHPVGRWSATSRSVSMMCVNCTGSLGQRKSISGWLAPCTWSHQRLTSKPTPSMSSVSRGCSSSEYARAGFPWFGTSGGWRMAMIAELRGDDQSRLPRRTPSSPPPSGCAPSGRACFAKANSRRPSLFRSGPISWVLGYVRLEKSSRATAHRHRPKPTEHCH